MKLVWKLLRQNISTLQFIGFACANLIGLTIILLAVQFYTDVKPIMTGKESLFKEDFLTITKKVNLLNSFLAGSSGFTDAEINDIRKQDFIADVGVFTPAQFNVLTGIKNQTIGIDFSTEMFFESIPDKFIDVIPKGWDFTRADNNIPIILPKNYLDLYNFGFAEANSLPKVTESLVGMLTINITMIGKGKQVKQMNAHIVGFSNRINTILVPDNFMQWANEQLGTGKKTQPAKLMLEVKNIADSNLSVYLKNKGYETGGDNNVNGKLSFFLTLLITIVVIIGMLICALSFFILLLSINLLLEKNMQHIKRLRLLGYGKSFVVRPYELLSIGLNLVILAISIFLVLLVRSQYLNIIKKVFVTNTFNYPFQMLCVGFILFGVICLLNIFIIRKKVN